MTQTDVFDAHRRRKVSLGLGLVYAGLCITVLAVLWFFPGPLVLLRFQIGVKTLFATHLAIVSGMVLTASALGIVGRFLCLSTPRQTVGTPFLVGLGLATLFDLVGIISCVAAILHFFWKQVPSPKYLETWMVPMALAGHFLFIAFLWRLAVVIQRKGLAILGIVAAAFSVATIVLIQTWFTMETIRKAAGLSEILEKLIIVALVGLVALFAYGNMLTYLRRAVTELSPKTTETAA